MKGRIGSSRDGLPPPEVRLQDGFDFIQVPVDEYGRVQIKQMLDRVKATIDPSYEWSVDEVNSHHVYHSKNRFLESSRGRKKADIPKQFRELPLNQIILPVLFHNWLHRVTPEVAMPDHDMMEYTIKAWDITSGLFQAVWQTRQWQRMAKRQDMIRAGMIEASPGHIMLDDDVIDEFLDTRYGDVMRALEAMSDIPEPFRLVDPEKPLDRVAYEVGRLAAPDARIFIREATS